ncbi:hypothetical protein HNP38_002028 [Chryseobacterium defluvii]|uniref:Uncharacterized protein n=1 Tax=Chryseobacterium defluvii TaxID=160396 RepID=A0A840KIL7_9FLAO|nr:hypothetical protein [Chryseobacterium defluvii]MBB4806732.1 hypothetical protein [Chryseobacterium defluvii]
MTDIQNGAGTPPAENTPTQTLFRFVSLRSPQLSDEKDQNRRFIFIPQELKNDDGFYIPVTTGTGSKRRLLQEQAAAYAALPECISKDNPANNLNSFKSTYTLVYNFAIWLAQNKNTCTYEEFVSKRDAVQASGNITYPDTVNLWNNLIYQVVTQKDFYIKEAIMQMILAIHVLQNPTSPEEGAQDLLNARIVLPKELMLDDETLPASSASKMSEEPPKETFPTEGMKKQQQVSLARVILKRYDALKKNLSSAEKQYNKEYQSALVVQEEAYQAEIAPVIAEYNEAVAAAKDEYCGVRPSDQEYDPKDPCRQPKEVPYPVLPKFNFEFREEVSGESLTTALKPDNLEAALDLLGFEFYEEFSPERPTESDIIQINSLLEGINTFSEFTALINESVEKLNTAIVENTDSNNEVYTSIGGIILPASRENSEPYSYQLCPQKTGGRFNTFSLSMTVPDSSWDVAGITLIHKEYGANNQIVTSTHSYFTKSRSGNVIYLSDLLASASTAGSMLLNLNRDFEFDITFTNGKTTHFVIPGITLATCLSGYFELTGTSNPGNPGETIDEEVFIPSGFGFKQIGIADYLKVDQSTHAYVEGEVAHIENIMAREYREKSTRKLRRSENTTTISSDTEREQLSDTTTANRFEMQTEIAKMIQEATDVNAYANFSASLGTAGKNTYNIGLGANYAHHQSKEESTRQATTQAQDVTSRAMDRIVNKVHEERIEKIIEEFEENNSHGFDNRKGDKHVVGVYRWVDKLMKNQIYNYGKRMMFEFMVPEPAKLHTLGMISDKTAAQSTLVKPEDPRVSTAFPMKDYSYLVTETVLKYWLAKYNVQVEEMLPEIIVVGKSLDYSSAESKTASSKSDSVMIPENYTTISCSVKSHTAFAGGNNGFGNNALLLAGDLSLTDGENALSGFVKDVPITIATTDAHFFHATVNIKCKLQNEYRKKWQQDTFNAIIGAYEEALVEYNNKLAEELAKAGTIKDSNPNFYRQIENTVLRKNCISYMADRTADATHGYGLAGLTTGSTFKDHETDLTARLDKYTAFVKFMEQAFEWENLSYYLYPFYWGNKQNWLDLYQAENTDPLFRAFLQSGMARVIVTVRPGFENAVQFYLATGKIWNGGEVPVIGDELYLSIVDEMQEPKGIKQGKAWLTRLPTILNILQAESIGLKVAHALPFTTEDPDDFEVPSEVITEDKFNFEKTESLLGVQPANSSEQLISGDWDPAVN